MIKFLSEDNIWETIKSLSSKSKRRKVAVAYFRQGKKPLINFRKGDTLIIAMNDENIKSGQANPYEIESLFKKGVEIFKVENLHAKIYIFDKKVIIGSPNISNNSFI